MLASWTSRMARGRAALDGQPGSKVFRTSSSSVVTVMLTCTWSPRSTISRKTSRSRVTRGLRVCTTSLGRWWSAQ